MGKRFFLPFVIAVYLLSYLYLFFSNSFKYNFFILSYTATILSVLYFVLLRNSLNRNIILLLTLLTLTLKFLFIFKEPLLSDDIYRYLWEGKILLNGFNPYTFPPNSEALSFLRDNIYINVNHKEFTAIYPPFNLILNALIVKLHYSVTFYKFTLFLFDTAAFFTVIGALHLSKRPLRESLIYFLNPLTTLEIEWSGHNDIIMLLMMSIGYLFLLKKRDSISSLLFYTLALLSKFVYIIFIPFFANSYKKINILIIIALLFYIPFIYGKEHIFDSLIMYSKSWEFNSSLFSLLKIFISDNFIVRKGLLLLYFVMYVYICLNVKSLDRKLLFLTLALILVSPTVHPWYGLWLLPLLTLSFIKEIFIFTLLLPISYQILERYFASGVWNENFYYTTIVYSPIGYFLISRFFQKINKSIENR